MRGGREEGREGERTRGGRGRRRGGWKKVMCRKRKDEGKRNGKERREKRNLKKKREEERKREKESRESVRLYLKFSASVGTFLGCSLVAAPVVSPGYEPSGNQQIVMRGHIMK